MQLCEEYCNIQLIKMGLRWGKCVLAYKHVKEGGGLQWVYEAWIICPPWVPCVVQEGREYKHTTFGHCRGGIQKELSWTSEAEQYKPTHMYRTCKNSQLINWSSLLQINVNTAN